MMHSSEVRQTFLDFFADKGHTILPSASLLPSAPNLLFTNAGMNPFVPYFLGERSAPYPSVADTQKCIRAGGKHNDLEDVGLDTYHHTLFEMLGNWSFADYFKQEAIHWAWELLTQVWGFPKERLYATIYQPGKDDPAEFDHEAHKVWDEVFTKENLDPSQHIIPCGKKDNFWMMGDTGPCGPCSEIHIDLTEKGDTRGALVNADSPLCIEIWNLVFIQFNAEPGGSYSPLSAQYVDTGMGLERVAGIIASTQNFSDYSLPPSNYASDLFTDLFNFLSERSGHRYQATLPQNPEQLKVTERKDCAFRILADHIRALSCSIADGILPGNEGRHYVLRRILRRAVLWAKRVDLPPGSFAELSQPLIDQLGTIFPELETQRSLIRKVLLNEEAAFERTLERGLQLFDKFADQQGSSLSGQSAFTLYDTYGFPLDLTQLIARERKMDVDTKGFEQAMEQQRTRARSSQKKSIVSVQSSPTEDDLPIGDFVGYEPEQWEGFETTLNAIIPADKEHAFLLFAQTPFYAEMGGQVGDTGKVTLGSQTFAIIDTLKDDGQRHLHKVPLNGISFASFNQENKKGQKAQLTLDSCRRRKIQRHHTGTHILHWALRKILGTHIHQAGSHVNAQQLRFDFSHFEALSPEQLQQVESLANQRILSNAPIRWYETAFDDKPENCLAFFGEKYGNRVRIVDIESWSVELCGGTHAKATGELGMLRITHESAIAAGVRRIEALVGESAYEQTYANTQDLQALCRRLSCKPQELENRLLALIEQNKELENKLRSLQQ